MISCVSQALLVVVLLLGIPWTLATAEVVQQIGGLLQLQPGIHRNYETIGLDQEVKRYELVGLVPGHSYEVRVSYPASIPAEIKFEIAGAGPFIRRTSRRLLNCEKTIFRVAADGSVQGYHQPVLLLSAARGGVHVDGPLGGADTLLYNIVLQELFLGIPTDTFPVIATCAVLLLVVCLALPFWTQRCVPRLVNFLLVPPRSGPGSSGSSGESHGAVAAGTSGAAASKRAL